MSNTAVAWVRHGSDRWAKIRWRMGILLMALVTAALVFVAVPASAKASCTDTEVRNHMTCETNPKVSKCVLSIASAGAVGGLFGGPLGFLAGVIGGAANCAIQSIG